MENGRNCLKERFSIRDKRLFEITEVEITRVDCNVFDGQFLLALLMEKILEIKIH